MGLSMGELKRGSTHNHKDDKDVRLGALQARAPRSACRDQDTLYKPGKSMGLSMGELKRGSTHNHKDYLDARLGAPGTGAAVSMPKPLRTLRTRKDLGAGRGKRGKHPQPQGLLGCPPWGTPGTGTAVSTPRPRHPLQAKKELGTGREKGEAPTTPRTTRMSASAPPGTDAAVSTPRPRRSLRTRKDLRAGREKKKGEICSTTPMPTRMHALGRSRHGRRGQHARAKMPSAH